MDIRLRPAKEETVNPKLMPCQDRDGRFNSFPRAASLLKTRRETRTVRFIGVSRYVDIRQIDSARSDVCFAV
jgi:hypothetical protein